MRKALFALILVAAAFAGGAAVNGPGLERVKALIRDRLNAPVPAPAGAGYASADGPPKDVPAAPLPPLVVPPPIAPKVDATLSGSKGSDEIPLIPGPPVGVAKAEPVPVEAPRTSDPDVAPAGTQADRDWASLRRRMRELGVSRYEVEGEPDGRSRFRCLIPLAGRRAVGQQFEGEGDDDFQAADAALRRVALWRATEMAPQ